MRTSDVKHVSEAGTTKNDEGRLVYLPPDLNVQLAAQVEGGRALERETGRIIPYLFPHLSGHHRGERIKDRKSARGVQEADGRNE
ncbi:MAG: hypothetical protein ACE5NC_09065 [Anaerolineae bacterium]